MTTAYRTNSKSYIHNLHFIQIWQPATQHILTKLHYVHTYVPIYKFKVFSLHNIINYSTCTNVRRILICSNVRSSCTWKIVFKTQNNELNELNECMFYKMFSFSEKHLKTVKLTFTIIFQKPCLLTLKVSKAFLYLLAFKNL